MFFQRLASFLLIGAAIYFTCRWSGLGKIVKFETDPEPESQSALEKSIQELADKKERLLELKQSITVTRDVQRVDKQLNLLTEKLDKLTKSQGGSENEF
jgi:hypothetical protein